MCVCRVNRAVKGNFDKAPQLEATGGTRTNLQKTQCKITKALAQRFKDLREAEKPLKYAAKYG